MKTSRGYKNINFLHVLRRDPCSYCGAPASATKPQTVDHILARAYGGPNVWFNYTPACEGCNQAKSNKSLLEFLLFGGSRQESKLSRVRSKFGRASFKEMCMMPQQWYDPLGLHRNSSGLAPFDVL